MSKSVKGTRTEAARKEGYEQIANIFTETAGNEKEHAEIFFSYLEGGDVEITAAYPAGIVGNTKANPGKKDSPI